MNSAWTEAIKEAYASAPSDDVILSTLQISHPALASDIFIVADMTDKTCKLEDGSTKVFKACGFAISLPASGENGIQSLNVRIDNADRAVSDFLEMAIDTNQPIKLTFRPYLASNLNTPQMNPPLVLDFTDAEATDVEVIGKATFTDIINRQFLTARYLRESFPSLGNA